MIDLRTDLLRKKWRERVRKSLGTKGYYYEPDFCNATLEAGPVLIAAKLLGDLYVPSDTDADSPVILTQPSRSAPKRRPFDRQTAIGWHNDFSTRVGRPELSLSWIRRGDPASPKGGSWRLASASAVIASVAESKKGKRLIADLSSEAEPFGYRDADAWHPFRVVFRNRAGYSSRFGLRFYRRALEDGAWLRFGRIPDRTHEIIARIEDAADRVGKIFCANTGALLVVDNRFSLHDRTEQEVTGQENLRRQAWLCFVRKLHQPLRSSGPS